MPATNTAQSRNDDESTLSLENHMRLRVLIPLLIAMVVMLTVSVSTVYSKIPDWSDVINDAMYEESFQVIRTRCNNRAALALNFFERVQSDLLALRNYAEQVISGEVDMDNPYTSYYGIESVQASTPPGYSNGVSYEYSGVFSADLHLDDENIVNSTILDNGFRAFYQDGGLLDFFFVGYESTGMFRYFPYGRKESYATFSDICVTTNEQYVGYDPRCRGWYQDTLNSDDAVLFSTPYVPAEGGSVVITASSTLFDSSAGVTAAVLGVDVSLAFLDGAITSTSIGDKGYAYLLDPTDVIVSYPDLDRSQEFTIWEYDFPESERDAFQTLLQDLKDESVANEGEATPMQEFIKDSKTWYITLAVLPEVDYTLALVVPKADLESAVKRMEDSLLTTVDVGTTLACLVIVAAMLGGYKITQAVTKDLVVPIQQIISVTRKLNNHELDSDVGSAANVSSYEMKEIFGHMSQLILALRYGNQSYYRGDFNRAMDNYMGVYEMMEAVDNKRGLGVCLNNIANLYLNQKDFQKAENYYGKAIQNVSNLIEQESDTGKQNKLKLIRANRKMNLGSMFTSKGDFKEAFRHLQEAYNEHVSQGNMSGIAQVAGNIVQAHIEMKEYQNADQLAEQVLQIVNRTIPDPQNITKEAAAAYQYVCLNMGLCRQARGDLAEAAKWFRYALDRLPTVVAQVSNPCLMGLAAYYAQTDPPKAKEIERLTLANVAPKDVYLVLDVSGSMLHNIQTCRTSMKKILAILNDNDSLQLTTFASELVEAFPLTPIRGNRETLASYIDTKTTLRGRTAFYDALLATGGKIENKRASNSWVVALTDGEDNESHFRSENNVRRLFGRLHQSLGDGFKLILITVGTLQNMYTIQSIQASAGPSSILIKADNVNEIQRAFESVAEMLTANLSVETL